MLSKIAGNDSKKNTKTKIWWLKLAIALILSNVFFFILFSPSETRPEEVTGIPEGWVEIQVKAELLTSFHSRKKVLLLQREARKKIEAVLEVQPEEAEGRFTVLVRESEAESLLRYESWEIIPFLKTLSFAPTVKDLNHEIRY